MSGNVTGTPISLATLVAEIAASIAASNFTGVDLSASNVRPSDTGTLGTLAAALAARLPLTGGTLTGALLSSSAGSNPYPPDGIVGFGMLGGVMEFGRRTLTGNPTSAAVYIYGEQDSASATPGITLPTLRVDATNGAAATGSTMAGLFRLFSNSAPGNSANEDQAVGVLVNRFGQNATWQFSGQSADFSGLPTTSGSFNIGMELDILANGSDQAGVSYNTTIGNRIFILLTAKPCTQYSWAANTRFTTGQAVQSSNSEGTFCIYIVTQGGVTAAAPPEVWPVSGSVTNGTVTFTFSQVYAMQAAAGLVLGAQEFARYASGITAPAPFDNAVIDTSAATFTDASVGAAIRVGVNQPIDFNGRNSASYQNTRTIAYSSGGAQFYYNIDGTTALSITDAFAIGAPGALNLAYGAQAQITGQTTGFVTSGLTIANGLNNDGDTDLIFPGTPGLRFYPQSAGTLGSVALSLDGSGNLAVAGKVTCTELTASGLSTLGDIFNVTTGYPVAGISFGYNFNSAGDTDIMFNEAGGIDFVPVSSGGTVSGAVASISGAGNFVAAGSIEGVSVIIGASGPTITSGSAAPTTTQPKGSLYTRTSGGVGTTLYVSQGAGTWNPVAGV